MLGHLRSCVRIAAIIFLSLILNVLLLLTPPCAQWRERITSRFFRMILTCCGIQVNFPNAQADIMQGRKTLVVANHVSYLDILIIGSRIPCLFLAKQEVRSWPLFGWVARALGCIFVKRDSLMGRASALKRCLDRFQHANIVIFPEGTTTAQQLPSLDTWAKGHAWLARKANMDAVLCLGLNFEQPHECAWTDDQDLISHLFKLLSRQTTRVTVQSTWSQVRPQFSTSDLATATWQTTCLVVNHASTH